jgi:3-oxoacyl-[acyl-carrier-protein] synthase III
VVLRPSRPGTGLLSAFYGADGENADAIIVEAGGSRRPVDAAALAEKAHLCRMDGRRVKSFIQEVFPLSVEQACERAGIRVGDLDFVISHQANLHLIREGMQRLGLGMERTLTLLEHYGNSGSASVPTVLDVAVLQGRIRPGDLVAMSAYGAGLAYGAAVMRWAGPEDFLR